MNTSPVDPLIGQTLDGRYVVRSKIARGGMAMVYLGDDLRLGRKVAIKIMHAHLADDENFTRRFEQEARSAAGLGHPNVVNVFDQGESNGVPYLVMEYLPGITLRDLLKQQRKLTTDQAAEISEAVLAGLAAAHDAGIVHRDLKPENVLLADDGRIKIGDFGLARAVSANTTTGQALLGTIAYLSPELVTRGIADERSDIYAFGIMLFEMLTGKQPYTGEQPMQIAYQHAHSDVPPPSSVAPEVPREFDRLVQWTTNRETEARPSDAREALEYLRAIRTGNAEAATSILPRTREDDFVTPSTAVLSEQDQQLLASPQTSAPAAPSLDTSPTATVSVAQAGAAFRRRRGRWIAAIVALFVAASAGTGYWFGQGPGSKVSVPAVEGLQVEAAESLLTATSIHVEQISCSSLEVAAGLAARTEPKQGTRVDRQSTVKLCVSSGPEMLEVPSLIGLTLDEAKQAIQSSKFKFGAVVEQHFDNGVKGEVILAVNESGEGLEETYPEQGVINLIVSAGSVPTVAGLLPADATKTISDAGLKYDASMNTESHDDSIEKGHLIGLVLPEGTLRVGQSVGFHLSLGPELVEVPDVAGKPLQDAMNILSAAGLDPSTNVPDPLRGFAKATGTSPKAGEQVKKGTSIQVRAQIDL